MNIILSLRNEPKHQRIDITDPELQPSGIMLQATLGEQKLIEMFRDLTEREKNSVLAYTAAINKESHRVRQNDEERKKAV